MKTLKDIIIEKLKIGKNTSLKNNSIDIDIESNDFNNVIDKIVEYCEELSFKPNEISDKFIANDGSLIQYDNVLLIIYDIKNMPVCFGIHTSNKLSSLYGQKNALFIIHKTGSLIHSYHEKNIDEIFDLIDRKIQKYIK